jgi:hypothetical protein
MHDYSLVRHAVRDNFGKFGKRDLDGPKRRLGVWVFRRTDGTCLDLAFLGLDGTFLRLDFEILKVLKFRPVQEKII